MAPKKKGPAGLSKNTQQLLNELNSELGGTAAGSPAQNSGSPAALGISAAQAGLPVTFSLPNTTPISKDVPGAKTENGKVLTSYAGAVQALYKMDPEQVAEAKRNLIDSGYLSSSTTINSAVTTQTVDAWKRMALDAAQSGTPVSTLLAAGGAAPAIVSAQKAAQSALQNAESNYAEAKTGGFQQTDPNKIADALNAAFAATGEGQPSPQLTQAFVRAFQGKEGGAEAAQLGAEKAGEGAAISQLQGAQADLQKGDIAGANAAETAPGPIITAGKPTPDLDAEAMAQAKANDPAEYYATQTSYLYGLIMNDIRGTPNYQTAPTAPSATAPGGASIGTPLVGG